MHRAQNSYAENRVRARVEKVKQARRDQAGRRAIRIPQAVHISPKAHSLSRFYQDYTINSGVTLFNLLPVLSSSCSAIYFQEALHAVALASSARQLQQFELMFRARRHYGKAISAINTALNDPVMAADDSLLITLLLCSLFEVSYNQSIMSSL